MITELKVAANEINIDLSDFQLQQFDTFYQILIEKNKVMNLTTITEEKDVIYKHFVDSISILNYITFSEKASVIDVGTGAGFPGIPLAILCPKVEFTLLDSLNKRVKYLDEVVEACQIKNVYTIHDRAEDAGRNREYREKFDFAVSRAVANLSILLEYCTPFVKPGGTFISYKASGVDEELELSKHAQKILASIHDKTIKFDISYSDISRTLLTFDKISVTPKQYPRQAGKPVKSPL